MLRLYRKKLFTETPKSKNVVPKLIPGFAVNKKFEGTLSKDGSGELVITLPLSIPLPLFSLRFWLVLTPFSWGCGN